MEDLVNQIMSIIKKEGLCLNTSDESLEIQMTEVMETGEHKINKHNL